MWNNNLRLFIAGSDRKEVSCDWIFYKLCWHLLSNVTQSPNTPLRDWWISYFCNFVGIFTASPRLRCILSGGRQFPTNFKETQRGTSKKRWLIATSNWQCLFFYPHSKAFFSRLAAQKMFCDRKILISLHWSMLDLNFITVVRLQTLNRQKSLITLHFLRRNVNTSWLLKYKHMLGLNGREVTQFYVQ